MTIDVNRVLKRLDKKEILADVYELIGDAGVDVTTWQPTQPIPQALDKVIGWIVDDVWNPYVVPAIGGGYLDYAAGFWLRLLAALRYNRPIRPASAATVELVVENRGSFFGTIAAGAMRVKHSTSGKTYSNSTAITLAAWPGSGDYPTDDATFVADEVGSASNALTGEISTTPVAAPVDVFVQTNVGAAFGQDEEGDASLKARCRAAQAEATGIRVDYEAVALDPIGALERNGFSVPASWQGVTPSITRVRAISAGGAVVDVWLASASGPAAGDDVTEDTDVFKAAAAIQLLSVKAGVTANVAAAVAHNIVCGTITLYIDRASPGVSVAEAEAWATESVERFFEVHPIGGRRKTPGGQGYVFADEVRDSAKSRLVVDSQGVERRTPIPGIITADLSLNNVALAANEVPVPSFAIVAVLVTQ